MADLKIGSSSTTAETAARVYMGGQRIARVYVGGQRIWDEPTAEPAPEVVPANIVGTSNTNVAYSTTAKTIGKPTGVAAGDMLFAVASCDWGTAEAFNLPSGFTALAKHDRGANLPKMLFGYKIATASEPTSYTFAIPVDADARLTMFAIRDVEPGAIPAIATRATPSSATTHPTPGVTPSSKHGLRLEAVSLSGSTTGRTFNWTAPAGTTEQVDTTTNGYQTQAVATGEHATTSAVPAASWSLTTTSAAMPGISASIVIPSLNSTATAGGGAAYPGATLGTNSSGGSGGPWSDRLNVTFAPTINGTVRSSYFHIYAAHLDGTAPRGILFHLHGDGAFEPENPTIWTNPLYRDQAIRHGFIYVCPRTPDNTGSPTWWENAYSELWLKALFDQLVADYPVDLNRVWWSGFSGGAQVTSYNMVADYHGSYTGGGAFMLGGGSMEGGSISGTPTSQFKAQFPMRWVVGELDDGSDVPDGFNAREAAEIGRAYYANAGFTTSLIYIPGESHDASEDDGPSQLGAFLDSIYGPK